MKSFWEEIPVGGTSMNVYSSVPEGEKPLPAVIIAHPASGVAEFTQSIADRLANAGYIAIAMDLFHRVTDDMISDGTAKNAFLDDVEILSDVDSAVAWAASLDSINSDRIGIIGFCMGGRIAWLSAASNKAFKAVVPYYGGNLWTTRGSATNSPYDLAPNIECPMLFHFGELDQNPSQDDMRKIDKHLTELGKPHQFYTYPDADHAFMDFAQPHRYNKQAADASWPRTVEFFDAHLKHG